MATAKEAHILGRVGHIYQRTIDGHQTPPAWQASPTSNHYVNVRTWLDTTRIYLTNTLTGAPPNIIYLLDTKKGANQKLSNVPIVFKGNFGNFDSSYNGKSLYISTCNCGYGGNSGPGSIMVMPATGGQAQTLYSSTNDAITNVPSSFTNNPALHRL